ncbi:MAG: hypothetical protein AB4368_03040 [Xenococcaceae cyanobacterium]
MINKLLSSTAMLTFSFVGIGFFSTTPAQAGCNIHGCSQSSVAECNVFGCPNAPMGQECNVFGCPPSPSPQSQSTNSQPRSNNNFYYNDNRKSDFQFCVEQYLEQNYPMTSAQRRCQHLQ